MCVCFTDHLQLDWLDAPKRRASSARTVRLRCDVRCLLGMTVNLNNHRALQSSCSSSIPNILLSSCCWTYWHIFTAVIAVVTSVIPGGAKCDSSIGP